MDEELGGLSEEDYFLPPIEYESKDLKIENIVREGVYTCLGGPNFETVAELNMLKLVGVDAVGMSTVHEVITARHCDLNVFALSLITNECVTSYDTSDEANHEEVLDVGRMRQDVLRKFVSRLVTRFNDLDLSSK